jgi:hypothetical protein
MDGALWEQDRIIAFFLGRTGGDLLVPLCASSTCDVNQQ